jgi:hypothetical protein
VNLDIVPPNETTTGTRPRRKYEIGIKFRTRGQSHKKILGNKEAMCLQNFRSSSVLLLMI